MAWALGLPVHEGYGLSECCAVVALNRPGTRKPGTVGKPLDKVKIVIDNGEIVVAGPTIMHGYLNDQTSMQRHRTGDAGYFDDHGYLVVEGRIDDVIVTSTGRNIHPAWIESMLLSDHRIARSAVIGNGAFPQAVLVPANDWLLQALPHEIRSLLNDLCRDAPDYAKPDSFVIIAESELCRHNLITANGRMRRKAISLFLEKGQNGC